MNLFKRISLFYKVKKVYRPFFKHIEKKIICLDFVSTNIDEKITIVYKLLKTLPEKKYKKEKEQYENLSSLVELHNDEIAKIKKYIPLWDKRKIIYSPYSVDKEYLLMFLDIANSLSKYENVPKEYSKFKKEVKEINAEYENICYEHDIFIEYKELFNLEKYKYITLEIKRYIYNQSSYLLSKLKNGSGVYYSFEQHKSMDQLVREHNSAYFNNYSKDHIFDDINGKSLDLEQRKAVLTDEKSVLVVAGAGSGKTLTICGKVEYLLKREKINPNDILLLSYSKKSADDLQNKISKIDSRLTVGTFHKIGLDILKETQNKVFMIEDQYKAIIEQYFREAMKSRPGMLKTILTYYGLYISCVKHDKKYLSEGDLYADLKQFDFATLKTLLLSLTDDINARETLKKEFVKSFEEMAIANWYFINGIDYTYEAPYEYDVSTHDKRQYMPDFKLRDYKIYHEHYGIDKDGKASQYEGEEATNYVEGIEWKRQLHKLHGTDCIETYSYEFDDGTIFIKLEQELKERGVVFKPLTNDQIIDALYSFYESRPFKSFINLVRTFLNLYKATYRDDAQFETFKTLKYRNTYEKNRAALFLDIVKDVYHYYLSYLKAEGKIDFDDMILESAKELDNTKSFGYKYIIVDEFQDISVSRMNFLKRLISQGNSKLFAVGDDWQAIYRFSGCDLNIFLEFGKYFGDSAISKITTTHRNSQELQDIAGPFIKKNPEQFDKIINSARHLEHPVQIMYYNQQKYDAFLDVLNRISKYDEAASVLILGRNNKDFEDIQLDNRIFIDFKSSNETTTIVKCVNFPKMKLKYSTVHGSKGLEDDYVILINADDARVGFPNKMEDDELLDLVLSHKSEYEYAEERRLWYVALTRTRNYTYIIADMNYPSIFLKEIENQCLVLNPDGFLEEGSTEILCPYCKSGRLVLRLNTKNNSQFFGCSNYPYCTYAINDLDAVSNDIRCPDCGDFMSLRQGKWGPFYGCHNYPRCKRTKEYDDK